MAKAIEGTGRFWATADQLGQGAAWAIVRSRARPYPVVGHCRYPGDEATWLAAPLPAAAQAREEQIRERDRARSKRWHEARRRAREARRDEVSG